MNTYWNNYFFHSIDSTATCPVWLWVVLGLAVVGFIGFVAWVIKDTWIR